MAANVGILCGIFGFSGLQGLIFYLLMFFMTSFLLAIKSKFEVKRFFKKPRTLYISGIGSDLLVNQFFFIV